MSFYSYANSFHLNKHSANELHQTKERDIPFFGEEISALSYLAQERKIQELHPFFGRSSKYHTFNF